VLEGMASEIPTVPGYESAQIAIFLALLATGLALVALRTRLRQGMRR